MKVVEPGSPAESLIVKAKNLLLRPHETWEAIDAESSTIESLYKGWVAPLAAIPAVCELIARLGFDGLGFGGLQIFGVHYHLSLVSIIGQALLSYGLTLVAVYVLALVIDELALRFAGERSRTQAFKLAAYSGTASWLAGAFLLLPAVGGLLALLGGVYSLYLLYLGLPKLMRSDPDRTLTYFALSLIVTLLLVIVIGALSSCMSNFGGPVSIT
jgi:hypothetical protein